MFYTQIFERCKGYRVNLSYCLEQYITGKKQLPGVLSTQRVWLVIQRGPRGVVKPTLPCKAKRK